MTGLVSFKEDEFSAAVTYIRQDEVAVMTYAPSFEMSGNVTSFDPSRWGLWALVGGGKKTTHHKTWIVPAELTITLKRGKTIRVSGEEATKAHAALFEGLV